MSLTGCWTVGCRSKGWVRSDLPMIIRSATYVKSSVTASQCPKPDKAEFAFIGRSNVGKSSLINMLTGYKKLAKTSSKPGKTRLINHFLINEQWYLVDMPGYGFAKVSQKERKAWLERSMEYFNKRENLINTFVLIDIRIPPQKIDLDLLIELGSNGVPFSIVFTKSDQITKNKLNANRKLIETELNKSWEDLPPLFTTSATTETGKVELLQYISTLIPLYRE